MHQTQACLSIADIQKFSIRRIHCTYIDFKIQKAMTTCHCICYLFERISKPASHRNKTHVTRRTYFGPWKISFLKALDEQRTNSGKRNVCFGETCILKAREFPGIQLPAVSSHHLQCQLSFWK